MSVRFQCIAKVPLWNTPPPFSCTSGEHPECSTSNVTRNCPDHRPYIGFLAYAEFTSENRTPILEQVSFHRFRHVSRRSMPAFAGLTEYFAVIISVKPTSLTPVNVAVSTVPPRLNRWSSNRATEYPMFFTSTANERIGFFLRRRH